MRTGVPVSRYWLFGLLAGLGLAIDLISKSVVFSSLGYPYHTSEWNWSCPLLWGRLSICFTTSFNEGALFGMGQGYSAVFAALSVAAGSFVLYWLFYRGEARSIWLTVALALIMSGTLGNLYDRLYLHGCQTPDGQPLYGVRDFLDCKFPFFGWGPGPAKWALVPEWPWYIFNPADAFLVTGAVMLTLYSFRPLPPDSRTDPAAPDSVNAKPAEASGKTARAASSLASAPPATSSPATSSPATSSPATSSPATHPPAASPPPAHPPAAKPNVSSAVVPTETAVHSNPDAAALPGATPPAQAG